jgi:hypothetical protein
MPSRTTSNGKDIRSVMVYPAEILHNVTGTKALRNFRTHGANSCQSFIFCSPGTVKMKFLSLKINELRYPNSLLPRRANVTTGHRTTTISSSFSKLRHRESESGIIGNNLVQLVDPSIKRRVEL